MTEKYKSMNQLNSETNIGNFLCKCLNSGVNSFTGMCGRCGMSKGSGKLLEQKGEPFQINEISAKELKTVGLSEGAIEWLRQSELDTVKIYLRNLISSTPNDQELGKKVREMFK